MGGQVSHDVLRRMVAVPPPTPEDVPITSSRAMRLAMTRAADLTHDMVLSVMGLREEILTLDEMLATFDQDLMLLAMSKGGDVVGLAALDLELRSALIEVQTIGGVVETAAEERAPTGTDASMAVPLLASLLAQLEEATPRTPLDGWGQGHLPGGLIANSRAAGLILPEASYRVIQMGIDLTAGDRQGTLILALPDTRVAPVEPEVVDDPGDWNRQLSITVNASPLRLRAQLHKFNLPLYVAEGLQVGQVIALPGCTVTSVKLLASDGRKVATARLGQSAGMRAVRLEQAVLPEMRDLDQLGDGGADDFAFGEGTADDMGFDLAADTAEFTADAHDAMTMSDENTAVSAMDALDETSMALDQMEAALDTDAAIIATPDLDWSDEEFDPNG